MTVAGWSSASNLLCIRLDAFGDVLMTSPAIRALKASAPDRRITLLASSAGAEVARWIPEIDEVIAYDAPWMKATPYRIDAALDRAMVHRLGKRCFDGAVVFTVYSQNPLPAAMLCYWADIPRRLAHCRENPYQLLTDWVRETEPEMGIRHEVRRQLDLVAAVGCRTETESLSLHVPDAAKTRVSRLLRQIGLEETRPWILIHPGASAPSRRYPPELYARAARHLVQDLGYPVLFTGHSTEKALVEYIRREMACPSLSLTGRLDLAELSALIERAPLLIANNTGPAHIAAAVGTRVVDLYALTNPQHAPWQVPHRLLFHDVPCKFCYKSLCPEGHQDCLRRVPPEAVAQAAQDLLTCTP